MCIVNDEEGDIPEVTVDEIEEIVTERLTTADNIHQQVVHSH